MQTLHPPRLRRRIGRHQPTAALAQPDPFDACCRLRNGWQGRIRKRLETTGVDDFSRQCDLLCAWARLSDPMAVWALLLWNTGVPADTAAKLRHWVHQGMPLGDRPD